MLLSLLGGCLGVALGAAATLGYASLQGWIVVVPLLSVAGAVATALALGATAGLYPALHPPGWLRRRRCGASEQAACGSGRVADAISGEVGLRTRRLLLT